MLDASHDRDSEFRNLCAVIEHVELQANILKIELELSYTSGWLMAARHAIQFPSGGDIFVF